MLQTAGFGGRVRSPRWGYSALEPARDVRRLRRLIERLHRRLARVHIDSDDFEPFLARFDRPGTLFYADPPYWGCEGYYGPGLWSRADFVRLERTLSHLRGRWLLSLNDHPEVRELFAAHRLEPLTTTYHCSRSGPQTAEELLISSAARAT